MELAFLTIAFLGDLRLKVPPFLIAYGVAFGAFAWLAWRQIRSPSLSLGPLLGFALLFRLTLFPTVPTLSDDIYRYLWDGKVQRAGVNPYRYAPSDSELGFLWDETHALINHPDIRTLYPPAAQLVFRVAAHVPTVWGQKAAVLLFDLLTVALLVFYLRFRGYPPAQAVLYAWNPLVIVEFAGSGHMDSIAIFFLVTGLWALERHRPIRAGAALAVSFLAKFSALILLPVLWLRKERRALGTFLVLGIAGFLPFLIRLPDPASAALLFKGAGTFASRWEFNGSLYPLLQKALFSPVAAKAVIGLLMAGGAVVGARREGDVARLTFWLIGAALLLSPTVHPWYLTWITPFLCFFPHPAWIAWCGTVVWSYTVLTHYALFGVWELNPWIRLFEYVPVYSLLMLSLSKHVNRFASFDWLRMIKGRAG